MKVLSSLAVAGAVLGLLAALLLSGPLLELVVLLGLATAVFLFLRRDPAGMVAGAVLAVLALAIALPIVSGISTQNSTFGDYLSLAQAHAFTVVLALLIAGSPLLDWDDCGPMWARGLGVAGIVLGSVFAFSAELGEPAGLSFLVAAFAAFAGVPAVMRLRGRQA